MITTPVKQWRQQARTAQRIGEKGTIVSWTMIRVPAKSFVDQAPYPVVIVKVKNKQQIIGQLVDWEKEDLIEGRKVVAVLRRSQIEDPEGIIGYTIKFKPQ